MQAGILLRQLSGILGTLVLLGGALMLFSPSLAEILLFQPSKGDPGPPPPLLGIDGTSLLLGASDGVRIQGWWYEYPGEEPAPAILFFHGNAGDISHRTPIAQGLLAEGLSVLLLEYRGYGGSEGRPGEEGLALDAEAGMDFVEERAGGADRVVVFGRSMGGAVAARLAARRKPGGLILEASFTSLEAMARALYRILPAVLFRRLRGRFDTLLELRRVSAPTLVIHGTEDEIVPFRMGEELFASAPGRRVWLPVEGAGHNDVYWRGGKPYFMVIGDFVRQCVGRGSDAPRSAPR
jgi:fermentation-respiration switch protein FrsA (DUF1100 family)